MSTPAGSDVPVRPSVLVRDAFNNVVGGATVTFAVTAGGGSVTGGTQTSDASGLETVGGWRLGPTAGEQILTASVAGVTVATFTATATAVTGPSALVKIAGDSQHVTVGTNVAIAQSVRVVEAEGKCA